MGGDAVGSVGIGGGSEVDGAASRALLLQVLEKLAIVGEMGDIELDGRGDMALERGLALEEPAGKFKERCGVVAGYGEG